MTSIEPGDTILGSTVIAVGQPFQSSLRGEACQSFGVRDPDGKVRTGTFFPATGFVRVGP